MSASPGSSTAINYGYPNMTGIGFGAEKLPDLENTISYYGSYYYYPNTRGTYSGFGRIAPDAVLAANLQDRRHMDVLQAVFLDVGYAGNRGNAKANAVLPGYTNNALYAGLGIYFNY